MVYNEDGQVFQTIDARGVVTENEYDALGQLKKTTHAAGTPEARSTSTTYDAEGACDAFGRSLGKRDAVVLRRRGPAGADAPSRRYCEPDRL